MKRTRCAATSAPVRRRADADARASSIAQRRMKSRRTSAALQLQACANVFAHSRIHFDPGSARAVASATDRNAAVSDDAADARAGEVPADITVH